MSILWLLQERSTSPLLLEEPELSLNENIVAQLPAIIDGVRIKSRVSRQVIITTHSEALLSNTGIDPKGIIVIVPSSDGSLLRSINSEEQLAIESGFSASEAVLQNARKTGNFDFSL